MYRDKSSKKKLIFNSNNLYMNTNSSLNEKTQDPEKSPSIKSQKSVKKKTSDIKKVKNYDELEVKEEIELPEIKRIREEVYKEYRIKQEELKMEKAFIYKAQLQKKYENKKLKDVDGKKYTFDAEGNQIQIKNTIADLPNNFLEPKLEMNDVKIRPAILRKENIESSIITGKRDDTIIGNSSRIQKKTMTIKQQDLPSLIGSMGNGIPSESKLKAGPNAHNLPTTNIIFPMERSPINPAGSNFK